jgi:hypothetical protein
VTAKGYSFNHKKAGYTFKVKVNPVQDGIWTRWTANTLCPLCSSELNAGLTGRIQKEAEVKSSIKSAANNHLWMVHHKK